MDIVFWIVFAVTVIILGLYLIAEFGPPGKLRSGIRKFAERTHPPNVHEVLHRLWMDVDTFAHIEKDLPGLVKVVVLSAKVENPTRDLAAAVLDNFQQGVTYEFFVGSTASSRAELEMYEQWFHHLFEVAKGIAPPDGPNSEIRNKQPDNLVKLFVLPPPLDWHDNVPYVFYSFRKYNQDTSIIAFRGDTPGSGISNRYSLVEPDEARSIIKLCAASSKDFRTALPSETVSIETEVPETGALSKKVHRLPIRQHGG